MRASKLSTQLSTKLTGPFFKLELLQKYYNKYYNKFKLTKTCQNFKNVFNIEIYRYETEEFILKIFINLYLIVLIKS